MKTLWRSAGFFLVIWACIGRTPAAGQDLRIRLFSLRPPSSVRIFAEPGRARYKLCPACPDVSLSGSLTLRAHRNRLAAAEDSGFHGPVEVRGNFSVEGGGTQFSVSGALRVEARHGLLLLTLTMPVEEYVAAVLAGEAGGMRQVEARKALAVAARTYAIRNRGRHEKANPQDEFDFCDTTHCQDLRLAARSRRVREDTYATEGEILWFRGEPASIYYHRHCGGVTENARFVWPEESAPYLRQQVDTFCRGKHGDAWSIRIPANHLASILPYQAGAGQGGFSARILERTPSGRVRWMLVNGRRMSGMEFLFLVSGKLGWGRLQSSWFEMRQDGDAVLFTGKGSGHGVGLCQAGAEERAATGHSYEDILAFYFPGTSLGVNAQGFRWKHLAGARTDLYSALGAPDEPLVALADAALERAEQLTRLRAPARPTVRVYPSIASFRNATGEPGWVAASTVGRIIRLQPASVLRASGVLEETLLHEFLHYVLESNAHPNLPAWFTEGIALYLQKSGEPARNLAAPPDDALLRPTSEAEMRLAYEAARSQVKRLVDKYGRTQVLAWLMRGLPARFP